MALLLGCSWSTVFVSFSVAAALLGALVLIYIWFFYVDIPKIKGIPELAGGELLAGHLYQLGEDHATTAEKWSSKYGWPVFQLRMGYRRAIMLNSFDSAYQFLVKNQSATIDRPWFYTFHGIVSATSAATIGTSPWNDRTKKQRRVVGSFTTAPSIQRLRPMLDLETCAVISGLYYDSQGGDIEIMPHVYQKRLSLNLMMMFCYGKRFATVTDPLLLQILSDANTISSFRSTNSNPQDFIPHLRYTVANKRTETAKVVRERRDKWLATMLESVNDSITQRVTPKQSVAEMLLRDSQEGLTELDIKTILGGLMSGGFETVFSTMIITIGVLSTPEGQMMQKKAYEDILSVYESPEQAFEMCLAEEKSAYVAALAREALRFYPPLKLLPARQTCKEFVYQGAVIPKGVLIYTNTQAVNRDKATYGPDADQFVPERWMDKERDIPAPYQFAFGAGGRMCTAVNFSNRVLYAMLLRLIVSFEITESKEMPANTHYIDYKEDPAAQNAIASDFKVRIKPRNPEMLERCFEQSQERSVQAMPDLPVEPLKR
ncbi:hypothetical protein PV11_09973 [Exophiala sideris]|uniref:Phenylacetate 2-hydroxylase n=1 Tax=Exophiala sideris TaxID=1016849 RepID=A0A0D1Y5T8_9EURO|nr:hypothetical protein PV11_09973 [Exophiala sideris]